MDCVAPPPCRRCGRNPSVTSRCGSPLLSADARSSDDVIAFCRHGRHLKFRSTNRPSTSICKAAIPSALGSTTTTRTRRRCTNPQPRRRHRQQTTQAWSGCTTTGGRFTAGRNKQPPLATENPSVPSRCGSPLLLLTCALLMTSSHSEGRFESGATLPTDLDECNGRWKLNHLA